LTMAMSSGSPESRRVRPRKRRRVECSAPLGAGVGGAVADVVFSVCEAWADVCPITRSRRRASDFLPGRPGPGSARGRKNGWMSGGRRFPIVPVVLRICHFVSMKKGTLSTGGR
jgi:hypothetical protein